MIKAFTSTTSMCSLFAAMAIGSTIATADEQLIKPAFGFDLSIAAALPNDRRFTGSTIGFELSLLAITNKIRVGFYHEQGHWRGDDGDEQVSANSSFNAMHIDYQIFAAAGQQVALFTNAGHIAFHGGYTKSAFAADLGVHYDPLIASARGVTTNFGVLLAYRYSHISSTEVFGPGSTSVDDAGGFIAGVHGLVRF
jgi:hypothetical protein